MKNLFKNLMLVAVAAMAFTACSQDVNEVNNVERTVRYEFTANFADDTRSGFAEETSTNDIGKTVYHSEWFGNETLFLVPNVGESTTAPISAEGKFSVDLSSDATQIDIYSPASSWSDYGSYCLANVPAEQTSGVNSVDPKAHIVSGYAMVDANGNQIIPVTLSHAVAYGKMTVSGVDFAIDHVVVDLKGSFSSYDRECSYTVKANGVDNTFWFATEPIDVAEFTVTAYDAEGNNAVTKTIDVAALENKTLSFNCGRVSTFSVSGLAEPAVPMFTSAGYTGNPGDKVVKLYSDTLGELWMNFYGSNPLLSSDNWINPGQYGKDNGMYFGGNYGQYKPVGFSNFLTSTPNSFTLDVSIVDGKYKFVINADYTNMYDGVVLENATFIGEIPGLGMPDMRTPLATPEVTYELNGKTLTVSWTPVDGAVGYYVHDYYYDIDTTTTDTTLTVNLSEYKWYYIYVTALAAADDANFKDSAEVEISFELKDPRTVLSVPTNVRATVDGRYATIEWDAVQGADYYTLSYYLNGNQAVDVEGTSHTIDVGFDVSDLWVYVFAKANDDNENYKSSTSWDANVVVNTGSDPSIVPIAFTTCELNEYISAQWRVSYNFSDGANNSMTLWLTTDHGANDVSLGGTQTYNQFYSSPGSVGNYYRFCPVNVVINGESKTVTGGNVKIESLGTSWNVTIKLTIDDGSTQIFTYSGGVGVTGGDDEGGDDSGEFTPDYTITSFSYVKMSTSYYTYQGSVSTSNGLSFNLYTPYSQGEEIHEGTYTYYSGNGNTNGDFTFSTRNFSPAPSAGTMVVSKDGDTYTINLTVVVGSATQKYQYVGTL